MRTTKVYRLTNDKKPLSFTLSSSDSPRHRLLGKFTEENGDETYRAIRYARNQNTPFVHKQQGDIIREQIVFEDGTLVVPEWNVALQLFMDVHPGNGVLFYEQDHVKEAKEEFDLMNMELEAQNFVKNADPKTLETIGLILLGDYVREVSTDILRRDMMVYARQHPFDLMASAEDPDINIMSIARMAFSQKHMGLRNNGRDIHYNFPDVKKKLLTVPLNADPYETFAAYLKSDDGVELFNVLKQKTLE